MNEIVATYEKTQSIRETAKIYGISTYKVRKTLIDAGAYSTPTVDIVLQLYGDGKTAEEIARFCGITKKTVMAYLPYIRGKYNSTRKNRQI